MSTRERCEHILELIDEQLEQYDAWVDRRASPTAIVSSTTPAFTTGVVDELDGYRVAS